LIAVTAAAKVRKYIYIYILLGMLG